jgi:hypothetical protein
VLETPNVLDFGTAIGTSFDLGAQLTDQAPSTGGACDFEPPAVVYGDGYGGIPEVRWQSNPWGEAVASETTEGCYGGAGSCIRMDALGQYNGFHIYYRQPFPSSTFATLSLRLRALSGGGALVVAPSNDGERCTETSTTVGSEWSEVTIDVGSSCSGLPNINAVTVDNPSEPMVLLVDEVRFAH